MTQASSSDTVLRNLDHLLPDLEALYKDVHSHPELSMQEVRTAGLAADRLRAAGYEVTTGVGKTGVVGLLRNGEGPTVMLRADMDALPIEEATGLPYASKVKAEDREGKTVPVGHMCGHDMHVAWLIGATALLAQARAAWRGTLMAVFQPAEETAEGAQAMIDDGLFDRFPKPAVVLGQHVMVGPAGAVAGRTGAITSAADSLQIRLFGRGAHGSMPQASIDPVVMAAATVMQMTDRSGHISIEDVKWRKPVVMLVNRGTRSGKEVLAYGFKQYHLGEIIGTHTAGAVLAASAFLMDNGDLLLLAVADVTVDGQRLEGVGVRPTIEVPFDPVYAAGRDPQLDYAVQLLSERIKAH